MTDLKVKKAVIYILFVVYALLALNVLFFIRSSLLGLCTYREFFSEKTNFVPFRTIVEFIGYIKNHDSIYELMSLDNLCGNLVIFMPTGVFFPAMWKKQRRFRNFVLTAAVLIISVEAAQFLTMCGSCDIDDFILNFTGALVGFALTKLEIVKRLTFTDVSIIKGE